MEDETAAVHTGEKILTEPRDQNRKRGQTGGEEGDQENTPVM